MLTEEWLGLFTEDIRECFTTEITTKPSLVLSKQTSVIKPNVTFRRNR